MSILADYRAPRPARRGRSIPNRDRVRDCAHCRRTLPIDQFYVRSSADPYLIGYDAGERYKRSEARAGRPVPSAAEIAAVVKIAAQLPAPAGKMLRVQPRCRDCEEARSARKRAVTRLRSGGATVDVADPDAFTARVSPTPGAATLEQSAATGLIVVDDAGAPVLPANSVEALRVCYAALLTTVPEADGKPERPARPGYLGDDRLSLLRAIPALAAAADGHVLARRAQDVTDCALVREAGPAASAAMTRLLDRQLPKLMTKTRDRARTQVQLGLLTREEADARFAEGVLLGALKWDPLHAKAAQLGTVVNVWAARQSEVRTRGEHWIGQRKDTETGHWSAPAAELVRDGTGSAENSSYEVHAGHYTHGTQPLRVDAEGTEVDRVAVIKRDVQSALATLDPIDREIVERVLIGRERIKPVAADLGMTSVQAKAALKDCRMVLAKVLGPLVEGLAV